MFRRLRLGHDNQARLVRWSQAEAGRAAASPFGLVSFSLGSLATPLLKRGQYPLGFGRGYRLFSKALAP